MTIPSAESQQEGRDVVAQALHLLESQQTELLTSKTKKPGHGQHWPANQLVTYSQQTPHANRMGINHTAASPGSPHTCEKAEGSHRASTDLAQEKANITKRWEPVKTTGPSYEQDGCFGLTAGP